MEQHPKTVSIVVDGQSLEVPAGISVAAAVLGHAHEGPGVRPCAHNSVDGSGRAPYCLMGVCFECLMEIDGVPNVQACLVPVAEGMVIRRATGDDGAALAAGEAGTARAKEAEAS